MRKRKLLGLFAGLCMVLILALTPLFASCAAPEPAPAPAPAEEELPTYAWRLAHNFTPDSLTHSEMVAIADEVKARTDGRAIIDVYPASQLGSWVTIFERMAVGATDIHFTRSNVYSGLDPRFGIYTIPYMFTTLDEVWDAMLPGGWLDDYMQSVAADNGLKILGHWPIGFNGLGAVEMPPSPGDPTVAKELLCRVPPGVGREKLYEVMGYIPTHLNWGDVFTGLSTGIIDVYAGGGPQQASTLHLDAINAYVHTQEIFNMHYFITQLSLWNSLDEETQEAIYNAVQRQSQYEIENHERLIDGYFATLQKAGVEVYIPTPEEIKQLQKAAHEEAWPAMEEVIGKEVLDVVRANVS